MCGSILCLYDPTLTKTKMAQARQPTWVLWENGAIIRNSRINKRSRRIAIEEEREVYSNLTATPSTNIGSQGPKHQEALTFRKAKPPQILTYSGCVNCGFLPARKDYD
jgi:negative regulator of sigma E activity